MSLLQLPASRVIDVLASKQVELWVEENRLGYRETRDALSEAERAALQEHESEIVEQLRKGDFIAHTYPLSQGQRGLWFLHQLMPESAAYHLALAVRIHSHVDVPALRRSLQILVNRHACLRTAISMGEKGEPVQNVYAYKRLPFEHVEASALQEDELRKRVTRSYEEPFDLGKAPLMRVHLFTRSEQDHVLLLTFHHVVFDGHSLWMLLRELKELYAAETSGTRVSLRPLKHSYADFVAWQSEMLAGPEGETHLAFWKRQVEGAPPLLDLPTDRPRPSQPTGNGDTLFIRLDDELMQKVKTFSKEEGIKLYTILAAAYQILLYRYSGQEDMLIGFLTSGRPKLRFARITGFFVNPVVLRASFSRSLTFFEFLARQDVVVAKALEHQDYPFLGLVERLTVERDPRYMPLMQVEFNFFKMPRSAQFEELFVIDHQSDRVDFAGLSMESYGLKQEQGQFDLALEIAEGEGKYWGQFKYNTDLFEESTIVRMTDHYRSILEGMVTCPHQRISEFFFLTEEERRELLVSLNDTRVEHPDAACLPQLFEAQVARTPDATALVFEDQRLTYGELNRRVNRLVHTLRKSGVGPDVLVGVCLERSVEMVVGLLGVLKAGGAYVPLDPGFPRARLAFILEDAGVSVLLAQVSLVEQLPKHKAQVILLDAETEILGREPEENPHPRSTDRNLAYVIYTSGSTGKPKGVPIPHEALTNFLTAMRERPGVTEQDILMAVTTLSFDIAGLELFLPLIVGAQVVIAHRATTVDGKKLAEEIAGHGITVMQATPATWRLLVDAGWQGAPTLKALCGGEALPRKLADHVRDRVGSLWNMYGPTETTIWSMVHRVEASQDPVPIGLPINNTTVYILDRGLQPVPIGVPGVLYIGGDGLARGYLNRPALTSETFIPDPFSDVPGARLYKTGDRVRYLPNGKIEFLGRIDDQVKVRGFRIEPGEIESVLVQHPNVNEAVVIATEDRRGHGRLVAYLVSESEPHPAVRELQEFVKRQLPDYMVPSAFMMLDVLPLTPNGKVDRRALHALQASRLESDGAYVAPRTRTEKALAEVWHTIIGTERIGVNDRFYDLGGDSLSLAEMIIQAGETFHVELPVSLGIENQTIRELAEAIDQAGQGHAAAIDPNGRGVAGRSKETDPVGVDVRSKPLFQTLLVKLQRLLIPLVARVDIKGEENIPRSGPLIVASNHVNWLDFPFLFGMLGEAFVPLSGRPAFIVAHRWKNLFHLYFRQIGLPVYLRRGQGDMDTLHRLLAVLRAGGLVSIAPEGTFNRGGLIRAKAGVCSPLLIPLVARVDIKGEENIPRSGPLIVASNHVNWLDFPFLFGMLGEAFVPLSGRPAFIVAHRWKNLFHLYFRQIGLPVYLRRGQGDMDTLHRLLAVLRAGGLVSIAPEGTFNRGGLIRAKAGVARLATRAPAPVLPIVMYGQDRTLQSWKRLRRVPVHIRIAPPIHLPAGDGSQAHLQRQADTVMEAMARMLPPEYRGVYVYTDEQASMSS